MWRSLLIFVDMLLRQATSLSSRVKRAAASRRKFRSTSLKQGGLTEVAASSARR